MTSVDPGTGPHPELPAALALQRAHRGEMAKLGDHYVDRRWPMPLFLAGAFEELVDAGLLALADPDGHGFQQVTLTDAGCIRYAQLQGTPRRTELPVPDPQFSITTPAGRRLSRPGDERGLAGPAVSQLPVRSPGAHLHPLLRRVPVADRGGEGASS